MEVRNAEFANNQTAVTDSCRPNRAVIKQDSAKYDKSDEDIALLAVNRLGRSHCLSFTLKTRELQVELTRLGCCVYNGGEYNFTVRIEPVGNAESATCVTNTGNSHGADYVDVRISTDDREVILRPNTQYGITVSCDTELGVWRPTRAVDRCDHFTLEFPRHEGEFGSPVGYIFYKILTLSERS